MIFRVRSYPERVLDSISCIYGSIFLILLDFFFQYIRSTILCNISSEQVIFVISRVMFFIWIIFWIENFRYSFKLMEIESKMYVVIWNDLEK